VEGKDDIKDLFGEKLGKFEANVRPEMWSNISSQLGNVASVAGSTGATVFTKTIIAVSVAASIVVVSYFAFSDSKTNELLPNKTISVSEKVTPQKETQSNEVVLKDDVYNKEHFVNEVTNLFPSDNFNAFLSDDNTEGNNLIEQKLIQTLIVNDIQQEVTNGVVLQNEKIEDLHNDNALTETIVVTEEFDYIGVLPNVFTPNGDRINDFLSIGAKNLSDFSIVVIDKNSKIVYQSTDVNFIWDGSSLSGDLVEKGSYIYYVTARNPKGELVSKHSILNIETDR
jgi:gliding motility-associated-like protein